MGHIVELPPTIAFEDVMAAKGAGYRPDLRIFTAGIESDRKNDRLVHMIGSSTEKDLQGDTMSILALQSMTKAAPNLTVWLNHDYSLPDSIFGSIIETPSIHHRDAIADLHLDVDVELENPNAARVKRFIDNGRRLGCSIGCMVTKYEVPDEDDDEEIDMWGMRPIIIHEVYVVEYSIVGIPANQRSWVENAIRGVFARTLDKSLVPAMKSLWPSAYKETMKGVTSESMLREYDALPMRPRPTHRLDWRAASKQFYLTDKRGMQKQLNAHEVQTLLNQKPLAVSEKDMQKAEPVQELGEELQALHIEDAELTEKGAIPNQIDPYGMSDNEGNDSDGDIDNSGDTNHSNGPMDAEGKVMLHADGLTHDGWFGQHTHSHDAFGYEGELNHSHLHPHINDNNHNHDHAHTVEGDKDMDPQKKASVEEALRAINKDGSEGLLLKAGGTHDPYKGTHTHTHDAVGHGDNADHMHEHSHDGENQHGHDHAGMSTAMDARTDAQKKKDPDNDGDDDSTAAGDTDKDQGKGKKELDATQLQYLATYNGIGKLLGLVDVTQEELLYGAPVPEPEPADPIAQHFTKLYAFLDSRPTMTDAASQLTVLGSIGEKMASFAKSLDGLGDVLALKKDAEETRATIALAKKELDTIFGEVQRASKTLDALKNMPIGNPTHQNRNVSPQDNTVSHDELLGISDSHKEETYDSLSKALGLTTILSVDMTNGQIMRYRSWPDGVGGSIAKGVRPTLTANQISFMEWSDVVAYREGKAAHVPYLDNQVDSTTK